MINQKVCKKLELHAVLEKVAKFAVSNNAKNKILNLSPDMEIEKVKFALDETAEATKYLNVYNINPDFSFDSILEISERARVLSVLSMRELLRVMRILKTSRLLAGILQSIEDGSLQILASQAFGLLIDKELEDSIDFCILNDEEMNDRASSKLYTIRQNIKRVNVEIKEKLQNYIRSPELAKFLQDNIITVRENRYVIPVKQEYKNNIPGLVHDQSASGSTVFLEPMAIVNFNNQLKSLIMDEKNEIERILIEFTEKISHIANLLVENEKIITNIDSVFAKARYGIDTKSTTPRVNSYGYISLKKARHPLIDKNRVVPIDIYFGKTFNILLITGPNTGGKTVSLKTVGIFILMIGCGLLIPAEEESEVSIFNEIYCDIGDEQSIEQNLSTFSSHITNITSIVTKIDSKSLVLLDELGAGTEPNEGSALALAITEFILKSKAKAVMTTHYSELKEYSLLTDNIENASMEFNPTTFEPTYKLVVGVPGSSNAIEIAKRLGLSEEIILSARSKISKEKTNFENVLRKAEGIRQDYEKTKDEVDVLKAKLTDEYFKVNNQNKILTTERESLLKNSKVEARRIIVDAQNEAEEIIIELKKMVSSSRIEEKSLFEARALTKSLKDKKYFDDKLPESILGVPINCSTLKVGDRVFVKKLNSAGTVSAIKKNSADVNFGKMTSSVGFDDLFEYEELEKPKKSSYSLKYEVKTKVISNEINILGETVMDAIILVDAFIDSGVVTGLNELKIVHGMGTGALRKGIHEHLKTHPNVLGFRLGKYGEGESGVTIVTLK